MRTIAGLVLIAAGLALGVYVGVYLFFIEGIIEFIHGVTANPVSAHEIAWGVVRVVLAQAAGGIATFFGVIPGVALLVRD